jgi:hypothetical protein
MDTVLNIPHITYKSNDIIHNFIIKPINFYFLNDKNPIILYEISHNEISCVIPFYMSDGKTNGYRGNLLFPFICISTNNLEDTCPIGIRPQSNNIIFKYKSCKDFNSNIINEEIIESIESIESTIPTYRQSIEYNKLLKIKIEEGAGLLSIMERIDTLLNFILAICTEKNNVLIEGFKDIDTAEYFIPIDNNDPVQFNTDATMQPKDINSANFTTEINKSRTLFINKLQEILSEYFELIDTTGNFNISYSEKILSEFIPINSTELNKILNICNNNHVGEEFNLKNKNYNMICSNFSKILYDDHVTNQHMIKITSKIIDSVECRKIEDSFKMFNITCNKEDTIIPTFGSMLSSFYMDLNVHYHSIYDIDYKLHNKLNEQDELLKERIRQLTQDTITMLDSMHAELTHNHIKFDKSKFTKEFQQLFLSNIDSILEYRIEPPKTYEKFNVYYNFLLDKTAYIKILFNSLYIDADDNLKKKYLKYKQKYLKLKNKN